MQSKRWKRLRRVVQFSGVRTSGPCSVNNSSACVQLWLNYPTSKITYHKTLPDDLFEFEIPEDATVIEH